MRRYTLLLSLLVFSLISFAQTDEDLTVYYGFKEPIPQSPEAAALFSPERLQKDLFTGTVGLKIPLVSLSAGDFSINLSLSYKNNGIKVSQLESSVGLGWVLEGLPRLSVEVRDVPDMIGNYSDKDLPKRWYLVDYTQSYLLSTLVPNPLGISRPTHDEQPDIFYYQLLDRQGKFVYNHLGYPVTIPYDDIMIIDNARGKILISNGLIYRFEGGLMITQQRICNNNLANEDIFSNLSSLEYVPIEIISLKGDSVKIAYKTFNYRIEAYSYSFTYPILLNECSNDKAIKCKDLEKFVECKTKIEYNQKFPSSIITKYGRLIFEYDTSLNTRGQPFVVKILLKNREGELLRKIKFNYHTYNDRVFLESLVFEDRVNKKIKEYKFYYDRASQIPEITSFSQDHWGYYNGKHNLSLLPRSFVPLKYRNSSYPLGDRSIDTNYISIGMLDSVVYPTGGGIKFVYEPNKYDIMKQVPVYDTIDTTYDITGPGGGNIITESFDVCCTGRVKLSYSVTAENSEDYKIWIYLVRDMGSSSEVIFKDSIIHTSDGAPLPSLLSYTTELWKFDEEVLQGRYELRVSIQNGDLSGGASNNIIHFSYKIVYPKTSEYKNVKELAGGIRVKKIIQYLKDGEKFSEENYFYNGYDELNKSKLVTNYPVQYETSYTSFIDCNPSELAHYYKPCKYMQVSSSTIMPLFVGGSPVFYPKVTISYGKNFEYGGEEIYFSFEPSLFAIYKCCKEEYIPSRAIAPITDMSWKGGYVIYKSKFKVVNNKKVLLYEVYNNYETSDLIADTVYGAQISFIQTPQSTFNVYESVNAPYTIKQIRWNNNINQGLNYTLPYCFEVKDGNIQKINLGSSYSNIYKGLVKYNDNYELVVPEKEEIILARQGDQITYPAYFYGYDVWVYKHISQWVYLDKQVIKRYDENGQNPVIDTILYYYEPQDRNLIKKVYKDSKGNTVIEEYKYPITLIDNRSFVKSIRLRAYFKDLIINGSDNISALLQSRLNSYFSNETEFYKTLVLLEALGLSDRTVAAVKKLNSKVVDATYSELKLYQSIEPQLYQMYQLKEGVSGFTDFAFSNGLPSWNVDDFYRTVIVDKVDKHNNIVEIHNEAGVHTVFLYGYGYSLPIAKIVTATYSQVEQALNKLGYSVDQLQSMGEQELIMLFDRMREEMFYAQITSYTYDPLLGVTSITNQNGYTTYYEYDNFGRLTTVKDDEGNIIKSYEYHFANLSD